MRKYDIILGNAYDYGYYSSTSTRLSLDRTSLNAKTFEQLFLHKLEFVEVRGCGDVFTLFPARLRQGLKNLKGVIVDSCKSLEEVFELGEADEGSSEEKEPLSSLTTLQLLRLPELKCIRKGPTRHVSLQSLTHLNLCSLDKLTFIFTLSLAQSLSKLERLDIRDCGELKHIIREEDGEREIIPESPGLPKLKTIIIEECGKLEYVFPVSVSPSLLNLEQIRILNAHNLKQIFYSVEGDALTRDGIIKFPELRRVSLSNCSFFGPKNFAAQLPSLQILEIDGHKDLGNLSAQLQGLTNLETFRLYSLPDMRFIWKGLVLSKLTTLEVFKCKRLTHVFTCSMIVSLVQLEVLKILSCEELEQIIAKDDDKNDQILLGDHLQSLCFPNLCQIEIRECNKLKSLFPVAMASGLPKLRILRVSEASQLLGIFGQDDHASPVNVEKEMVLPNLCEIEIRECNKLKSLFPVAMIVSLVRLKVLKILSCEELEQIIARDNDDEKDQILPGDHLQSLCFPNLREIEIRECNKLKSLFPVAMASGLPELRILTVKKSSQLWGVFGQEDHDLPVNVEKEMVLPNLNELSLEQLSSIVYFSFGCCDFLFPRLEKLKVHQCPKLTTKFATTPDGSMSAQSEVSEVAEDSSINREWNRYNWLKEDGDSCL